MANTKKIGNRGERLTTLYLWLRGYKIIERNYSSRMGEIDIICSRGKYLAFVEVKTRGENSKGSPGQYVDIHKQRRIIKTAYSFLAKNRSRKFIKKMYRFDVSEVTYNKKGKYKINYIKNAFMVENY